MNTFVRVMVTGLLALTGAHSGTLLAQRSGPRPRAVPGELIVKFRANAATGEKARARGRAAAAPVTELSPAARARTLGGIELVRVAAGTPLDAAIARLQSDPAVEYAEPNWIYQHASTPNDPSFPVQWNLENTGQLVSGARGTADADIDAVEAWQTAPSATGVYIGVLDEGIDLSHPDLGIGPGGAIWTNPFDPIDGIDNDRNGYVDDRHGWDFAAGDNSIFDGGAATPEIDAHGTHVAGILAARSNNGRGIAGVSPGVTIIPAKFLGVSGGTTAAAILALDYLTDLKIRHGLPIVAINNSWTGGGYSRGLLEAITRAARQDILFIAAAGNGGDDDLADDNDAVPNYPSRYNTAATAGYDAVIAVTATGQSDELTSWSNYGLTTVDLAAPGAPIASTMPQNGYSYWSGTSMAVPHVAGAAALTYAVRGLEGYALKEALLSSVDPIASLNGRTVTGGRLNMARAVNPNGGGASDAPDIVLYATRALSATGDWLTVTDSTAADGSRLQNINAGAPKQTTALADPSSYFELEFRAEAGRAYHLWLRGRAEYNHWANDSVFVQFDNAVDRAGAAAYRIGSTAAAEVNLEDCNGCGLAGWGWQDNGYGSGVLGPAIFFASTGPQRLRIQVREDGLGIDQIVLSPGPYLSTAPGPAKNDRTLLDGGVAPAPADADEIVLYAADASFVMGRWRATPDGTAAGGLRLQNPNLGAPRIVVPHASPADYFELTFRAAAGKPYRLWLRGKAEGNGWANDSVHVQFNDSVDVDGNPIYRIETWGSAEVNIEDCSGCGLSRWGWQDTAYGPGVTPPVIRFATAGLHTIRVQVREDGIGIDQIVLSTASYLSSAPGTLKNDATLLPRRHPN